MNRRELLSACAAVAGIFGASSRLEAQAPAPAAPSGPFTLPPLGYAYDALEPYIDAQTMQLHHDKHHKAYVDNLNKAVAAYPDLQNLSVEDLVTKLDSVPEAAHTAIRNQGGGHANHSLFWKTLSKGGGEKPKGELAADIDKGFGSLDQFKDKLSTTSTGIFGSGWGWVVLDKGALKVMSLPNQDSPLAAGALPVFGIDVWEHAYYLKYQNRRPEYVKAIWSAFNWDFISDRYAALKKA
jgi:Fe-Mn family superoxide dismutase